MPFPTKLQFDTSNGLREIQVDLGSPIFVLGPNGSGKSVLAHIFVYNFKGNAVYLPGSRPVSFAHDELSITPAAKASINENFQSWFRDQTMRFRASQFDNRNQMAIHNLQSDEIQSTVDAFDQIKFNYANDVGVKSIIESEFPFERANRILGQINVNIRLVLDGSELKISQSESLYSFAQASDGERSVLLLLSEMLTAPPGSLFVIDEPERHLHRSIIIPLISSMILERTDCAFLIVTHEVGLPEAFPTSDVVLVRGCTWENNSVSKWDLDIISGSEGIPEDIRVDILGSRRKIVFVEGVQGSLDRPLYALLFPEVSIVPKSSCADVRRAVSGLKASENLHSIEAFGIVDNDNMTKDQVDIYEYDDVYPISMYSVESLYYCAEVRAAVASRQAETLSGVAPESLMADAKSLCMKSISKKDTINYLSIRRSEQILRDRILNHIPDRKIISSGGDVFITIKSPYNAEYDRLQNLIVSDNLEEIIREYPVRSSGVLDGIVKGLRFVSRGDYESAALKQISVDKELLELMRLKIGKLAQRLI